MGKILRKGDKGAAQRYITRNRAVKLLQLPLADFRRLCILKGIYPIEPKSRKKANKGSTAPTTFYYRKDIYYLKHEPIIEKFREIKTWMKRITRLTTKNEIPTAKKLYENLPTLNLDHVVKERYPRFMDALRDLDDALCLVFLFAVMPSDDTIPTSVVKECRYLAWQFQNYIVESRSLDKVFFSIKGIYYQAEIRGQKITWITPYEFLQKVPEGVDFKVMSTFLEFYKTLLGFVNFMLFTKDLDLKYPPKINNVLESGNAGISCLKLENNGMNALDVLGRIEQPEAEIVVDQKELENKIQEIQQKSRAEQAEQVEEPIETMDDEEDRVMMTQEKRLFEGFVFFLNREVPRNALEFIIKSFGGSVGWAAESGAGSPYKESDDEITHHICDRDFQGHRFLDRHYLQPQWVFDAVNQKKIPQTDLYAPGQLLPPHISPFVDQEHIREEEIEELDELENEKKELAISMMNKKDKRLYKQIQFGINKKKEKIQKLKNRRPIEE